MDMHDWMYKEPGYTSEVDGRTFRQNVWDAMLGLVSGVTYIHREMGGEVGYHGDLKPKNILLFKTAEQKLGWTWRICDFGSSNLKPVDATGTIGLRSTPLWAPEEWFDPANRDGQNHGRSHDVFSLGRVLLVLAGMMVPGWQDIQAKWKKLETEAENGHTIPVEIIAVVQEVIQHIKDENPRGNIRKAVELIEEMVKPVAERPFAWEIEIDLLNLIDPDITEDELLDALTKVIQKAREVDRCLLHNPWKRAKGNRRSRQFLEILQKAGWCDEETQEPRRNARLRNQWVSTVRQLRKKEVLEIGREGTFDQISTVLKDNTSVALSGLGGAG